MRGKFMKEGEVKMLETIGIVVVSGTAMAVALGFAGYLEWRLRKFERRLIRQRDGTLRRMRNHIKF